MASPQAAGWRQGHRPIGYRSWEFPKTGGCAVTSVLAYCIPAMSESRTRRVMSQSDPQSEQTARAASSRPALSPIDTAPSFKHQAYAALKNAIVAMDIYRSRDDI